MGIGVITAWYCMIPLYHYNDYTLYVPYLLGFILGLISIISCIAMHFIEQKYCSNDKEIQSASSTLNNNFSNIKHFDLRIWLIIITIIVVWSSSETFLTLLTAPLMTIFSINQWSSDILLSSESIYALVFGQIWGWLTSKYGYYSY